LRAGEALRLAGRDLFFNSWRLVPVNAAIGLVLAVGVAAALAAPPAAFLLVLAGPLAAALVHCAVLLARNENVTVRDVVEGLRLHWLRGLELAAAGVCAALLGAFALRMYFGSPSLLPLGFLVLYLLALAAIYGLIVWTLAIAEPERTLAAAARRAAALAIRRPRGLLALGLVLLLVNALGLAAGVMPFLTVTVAYSFLAVANFTLREVDR
jgi:hypothetical protein